MDDDTDAPGLPEALVATLADPAGNAARVPSLLRCLDGEDPDVRLAAGTALCLVAGTDDELRAVVVERLLDRFGGDAPPEVGHTLEYLAVRYPETVRAAVDDLDGETDHRAAQRLVAEAGEYRRSESLARTGPDRPVGRTRVAGADRDPDPRPVYTRETDEDEGPDDEAESNGDEDGDDGEGAESGGDGEGAESGDDGDGPIPDEQPSSDDEGGVTTATLRLVSRRLSAVVAASRFDDLTVLSEGRRDRYGDVYRTVGRLDGENYAVALTVYRAPDSESFVDGFRSVMADWRDVGDHEAVLPVYDWGVRPRPWAAVEYAGGSLATHGQPEEPLWTALELAAAVGYLHQHGVAHGAVDPGNVAYREVELDGSDRQPLLTNPGVATLAGFDRGGDDRAGPRPRGVDPRYAAPEHYDEDYGRVDAATDIYGLGALLFRLVTGDHPYVGDPETVRTLVCSTEDSPADRLDPSLSEPIDRVVRKATATRKIKRYETVTAFERELRQAGEVTGSDGTDA